MFILIFIFGTIIGSFLNVVILRYDTGQSVIKGRSQCSNCQKKLNWYELVPIISFLIQKGRCRKCKSKISWQYPIVEILTGIIFLLIFNFQFSIFKIVYFWVVFSVLIIIAVYDLKHQVIPDIFVYLFIFFAFLNLFENWNLKIGIWNFLAGIIFFAFFGSIWLVSRGNWMGLGDAKLSLGIGWLLGLFKGILALLLSFWTGALIGIFLLFFFKKEYNIKSRIPFGPFLILGIIIAFFFGDAIIKLVI